MANLPDIALVCRDFAGEMSGEMQALCFLAGASSIFYGEQLLATPNPENNKAGCF